MPGGNRAYANRYTPPAIDSPRARANAVTFLLNCAKIDHLTAEWLAHQYRLKPATAAKFLAEEVARRG